MKKKLQKEDLMKESCPICGKEPVDVKTENWTVTFAHGSREGNKLIIENTCFFHKSKLKEKKEARMFYGG